MLPSDIVKILVCPVCKTHLIYDTHRNIFICKNCRTYYPVIDGIPDLRPEAATKLPSEESEKDSSH